MGSDPPPPPALAYWLCSANNMENYVEKVSESKFIASVESFLVKNGYVHKDQSYFGEDDNRRPDVQMALNKAHWPKEFPDYLLLEAKSHHSTDSPNTINKIFGQLLKETGKETDKRLSKASYCLGVLILEDGAQWTAVRDRKEVTHKRGSGTKYYQEGFRRIDPAKYIAFGELVDARYVLTYSRKKEALQVYSWEGFFRRGKPVFELSTSAISGKDSGKQT